MPDPKREEEIIKETAELYGRALDRGLFWPTALKGRTKVVELPSYVPNSEDVLAATVKPFIYFAKDGAAYWCRGGEIEMRNLKLEIVEDIDPEKLVLKATVETKLDLIGETTEPWIRNEKDVPGEDR